MLGQGTCGRADAGNSSTLVDNSAANASFGTNNAGNHPVVGTNGRIVGANRPAVGSNILTVEPNAPTGGSNGLAVGSNIFIVGTNILTVGPNNPTVGTNDQTVGVLKTVEEAENEGIILKCGKSTVWTLF